jgi:hypothetical protein
MTVFGRFLTAVQARRTSIQLAGGERESKRSQTCSSRISAAPHRLTCHLSAYMIRCPIRYSIIRTMLSECTYSCSDSP